MDEESPALRPTGWIDLMLFLFALAGCLFVAAIWTTTIPLEIAV